MDGRFEMGANYFLLEWTSFQKADRNNFYKAAFPESVSIPPKSMIWAQLFKALLA